YNSCQRRRAMMMDQKRLAEFDALIGSYYGRSGVEADPRKRVQDLLAAYYGAGAATPPGRAPSPSVSLSLGCDDGEVPAQPVQTTVRATTGENAEQAASLDFEEYVVDTGYAPSAAPPSARVPGKPEAPAPPPRSTQAARPDSPAVPPEPAAPLSPPVAAAAS